MCSTPCHLCHCHSTTHPPHPLAFSWKRYPTNHQRNGKQDTTFFFLLDLAPRSFFSRREPMLLMDEAREDLSWTASLVNSSTCTDRELMNWWLHRLFPEHSSCTIQRPMIFRKNNKQTNKQTKHSFKKHQNIN